MRVFKWSADFCPEKESLVVNCLKAHLFDKSALLVIAKSIGNPLYIDESTANGTRPSTARICTQC